MSKEGMAAKEEMAEEVAVNEAPAGHLATEAKAQGVPPGYKQTEVGVIPEGWHAARLGVLANIARGASPRPIDSPVWFDEQSNIGWLRISDVTSAGKYLTGTTQNLSDAGIANSRFVNQGNLVMSICATVGRPIITRKDVCIHDGFVVFDGLKADKEYLYYVLSDIEKDWSKYGQTGSQMNLNTGLINSTFVPLPSTKVEQRAIAAALSDVDVLIAAQDKLIAKKRAIKTAVMQQLLTGKQRLPGFSGEWDALPLGRLIKLQAGYSFRSENFSDIGMPVIRISDIQEGNVNVEDAICHPPFKIADDFVIRNGDILVAMSGATTGKVGVFRSPKSAYQNQRVGRFVLRDKERTSQDFVGQVVRSSQFGSCLSVLLEQGAQPNVSGRQIESLTFPVPGALPEQTAIAAVLSDMDADIAALEARRDKTKAIKQGMMQELLTGRTRLV